MAIFSDFLDNKNFLNPTLTHNAELTAKVKEIAISVFFIGLLALALQTLIPKL